MHAAHGGFNRFDFSEDVNRITPMGLSVDDLNEFSGWMVLVYTGRKRHASEVLDEQMDNTVGGAVDAELADKFFGIGFPVDVWIRRDMGVVVAHGAINFTQ